MRAIVRDRFGSPDVLRLEDVEKPVPRGEQVLVRVRASSINKADMYDLKGSTLLRVLTRQAHPKDRLLGTDLSGTVEAVGEAVTKFKPGDAVFGAAPSAYAEYACATESRLAPMPSGVSFEQVAAIPVAGTTALQGLRDKGRIEAGQKVLIDGASGGVGSCALQLAKSYGAEVTAVCSTRNLDNARRLGADLVIDYTKEDFTKRKERYDLIFIVNGYHSVPAYRRALKPGGRSVLAGSSKVLRSIVATFTLGALLSRAGSRKSVFMGIARVNQSDLLFLKGLMEAGKLVPSIDRTFQLGETADAFRYFMQGHTQGKVVVVMAP